MKRTYQQNRALHLYFKTLSEALNDAGYDMRAVLKPDVEIPWNEIMIKEHLWRPVMRICTDKKSTTELTTVEVNEIYEIVDRHLAEKLGMSVPFPSEEND